MEGYKWSDTNSNLDIFIRHGEFLPVKLSRKLKIMSIVTGKIDQSGRIVIKLTNLISIDRKSTFLTQTTISSFS